MIQLIFPSITGLCMCIQLGGIKSLYMCMHVHVHVVIVDRVVA